MSSLTYHGSERDADATVADIEAMGRRSFKVQADVSSEKPTSSPCSTRPRTGSAPSTSSFPMPACRRTQHLTEMTLDDWNTVISINLTGAFLVGREAVRRFRKKGMREGRFEGARQAGLRQFSPPDHPLGVSRELRGLQGRHRDADEVDRPGGWLGEDPGQRRRAGRHRHRHQRRGTAIQPRRAC